jgi:hypothetical protein
MMVMQAHTVTVTGAALALICFFLPWVAQSCGNEPPRVRSGWELVTDGDRLVLLVPLLALAALGLALLAWRRGSPPRWQAIVSIGLGALGFLYLALKFGGRPPEGATRDLLYGLWCTAIALLMIVAGGVVNLFEPVSHTRGPLDQGEQRQPVDGELRAGR